jgi:hypothetical protein
MIFFGVLQHDEVVQRTGTQYKCQYFRAWYLGSYMMVPVLQGFVAGVSISGLCIRGPV